ncbi:MAG: hypothetical protein ACJ8FY_01910 [Gemmataceae bacterium]
MLTVLVNLGLSAGFFLLLGLIIFVTMRRMASSHGLQHDVSEPPPYRDKSPG